MQPADYESDLLDHLTLESGELRLQAAPSQPFDELIRSSYSYCCVLSTAHKKTFKGRYAVLRNPLSGRGGTIARARVAVSCLFDAAVPEDRIVLDETVQLALGMQFGHFVVVSASTNRRPHLRGRVFGDKNCLMRVTHSNTIDQEKELTRVPEPVADILSLSQGDRVVIEAATAWRSVRRLKLRALPERSGLRAANSLSLREMEFADATGFDDLPKVSLDVSSRERLGVAPGSPVYVRPAVTSALAKESGTASLVFLAAIFSAAALQNTQVAVVAGIIYLLFMLSAIAYRLR
jgi:hypothetical protein